MKLQLKLIRNLAKVSMKFHVKFHRKFDKYETSIVLHWSFIDELQPKINEISMSFRIKILKKVKLDLDCHYFFGVKKCQYPSPQFTSSIGTSSLIIWSFLNSNFFFVHFCVLKMGGHPQLEIYYELYDSQPHFFFLSNSICC